MVAFDLESFDRRVFFLKKKDKSRSRSKKLFCGDSQVTYGQKKENLSLPPYKLRKSGSKFLLLDATQDRALDVGSSDFN